jgi:hypothetical protein
MEEDEPLQIDDSFTVKSASNSKTRVNHDNFEEEMKMMMVDNKTHHERPPDFSFTSTDQNAVLADSHNTSSEPLPFSATTNSSSISVSKIGEEKEIDRDDYNLPSSSFSASSSSSLSTQPPKSTEKIKIKQKTPVRKEKKRRAIYTVQPSSSGSSSSFSVDGSDDCCWITKHPSVGTKVSSFFPCHSPLDSKETMQLFTGKVTRFAPETAANEGDELYHICWEGGDEEDYSEDEYQSAN